MIARVRFSMAVQCLYPCGGLDMILDMDGRSLQVQAPYLPLCRPPLGAVFRFHICPARTLLRRS